jgi:hypothetical protein
MSKMADLETTAFEYLDAHPTDAHAGNTIHVQARTYRGVETVPVLLDVDLLDVWQDRCGDDNV